MRPGVQINPLPVAVILNSSDQATGRIPSRLFVHAGFPLKTPRLLLLSYPGLAPSLCYMDPCVLIEDSLSILLPPERTHLWRYGGRGGEEGGYIMQFSASFC